MPDLDALVLATGFVTERPPIADAVRGTTGTLAEAWRNGMRAYASVAVPGFPNLFVLDGPNAALGHNSAVHVIESQIAYVLGAVRHVREGAVLDVDPAEEARVHGRPRASRRGHGVVAVRQLVPDGRAPDRAVAGHGDLVPGAERHLRP